MGRDYEHCLELQKKANDLESAVSRSLGQVVNHMYTYHMLGFILFVVFTISWIRSQLDLFTSIFMKLTDFH